MLRHALLFTVVSLCVLPAKLSGAAEADSPTSGFRRFLTNFQFLPYYYLKIDLSTFLFHKSSFFRERYYLSTKTEFEFALLGVREKLYSVWGIDFHTGMGKTPSDVLFDPVDLSYGIVPIIEYRTRQQIRLQVGLDHRCFHEIDRKEFPTVYYNKLFVGGGSHNMRIGDYWRALNQDEEDSWGFKNRFSWYARWGFFMKGFGDLVDPAKVNGNNNAIQEVHATLRYAVYRRRSWVINLTEHLLVGSYKKAPGEVGGYWRQVFGVESHFRRGAKGGMIFLNFTLDDQPQFGGGRRFSKDRLLEIGVAFYI